MTVMLVLQMVVGAHKSLDTLPALALSGNSLQIYFLDKHEKVLLCFLLHFLSYFQLLLPCLEDLLLDQEDVPVFPGCTGGLDHQDHLLCGGLLHQWSALPARECVQNIFSV